MATRWIRWIGVCGLDGKKIGWKERLGGRKDRVERRIGWKKGLGGRRDLYLWFKWKEGLGGWKEGFVCVVWMDGRIGWKDGLGGKVD